MRKLFFNLILISNLCFSQTTDWVKSFGGPDSDKGISIGCDSMGFVYCSGFFNNQAVFGNDTLKNSNWVGGGTTKKTLYLKLIRMEMFCGQLQVGIFLVDVVTIEL